MTLHARSPHAHRDRHVRLHRALDELVQDYVTQHPETGDRFGTLTVKELLTWAAEEAVAPTEPFGAQHRDEP